MSSQKPVPNNAAWLQDIDERCRNMAEITRQREESNVIQLPLWPESRRGSPNSFLRSALFAAIQGKDRIFLEDATIFSQKGNTIKFTGRQLNQEDMTVCLALVHLARQHPLGNECSFTAYGILKHMGLAIGKTVRERLQDSVNRLAKCSPEIETERQLYVGHIIDEFRIDKDTKHYKITFNKKIINLFSDDNWTALNWEQRKQLKQKPLAQKLHEYYSTHEFPKPVTLEFLYNITGSTNKDKRSFKRQAKIALGELIKIGFLESYDIEDKRGLATVKRVHTPPAPQIFLGG